MNNQSITTISLSLFGRISPLLVSDDRLAESVKFRMKIDREDYSAEALDNNRVAVDFKKELFSPLIDELILLVESVVLSDSINVYHGYKGSVDLLPGWKSFLVYGDEANNAYNLIANEISTAKLFSIDDRFEHVTKILAKIPIDEDYTYAVKPDGSIELDMDIINNPLFVQHTCGGVEFYQILTGYIDNLLGSNWNEYQRTVMEGRQFPDLFFNRGAENFRDVGVEIAYSKKLFCLALFSEVVAAASKGGHVLPSLNNKCYFDVLGNMLEMQVIESKYISTRAYTDALSRKYEERGIAFTSLLVPQIMNLCLDGAESIKDVIVNSIRLRNIKWVVKLRNYMRELCNENDPVRWLKAVSKLSSFIERDLGWRGFAANGNIGLSSSGSLAFSLNGYVDAMSTRYNPVIVFNAKARSLLVGKDSIDSLSRVFRIPRADIVRHLKSTHRATNITGVEK